MPSELHHGPLTLTVTQSSHLLLSFTHFLTVAIHNVLFYRSLYPPTTFLTTRAYNLAVHQSRHPAVCNWIRDAVDAIRAQLVLGSVSRIAIVIHAPDSTVLERWMIDVAQFPAFKGYKEPRGNRRDEEDDGVGAPERVPIPGEDRGGVDAGAQSKARRVNWTDVDEAFRAAVRRMALAGEKMSALPEGCSFTVAVELRDESEAPIGYPQSWIPSEPHLQPSSKDKPVPGGDIGGAKTTPIRSVEVGPLFFECWVEEGKTKGDLPSSSTSSD
ncbi:hypothetical protein PFICI_05077 [Pestalotiopsis fici W106-1]|uniref:HORMA domain-containing protein n=1 Tax=Pestalotiopsis fici (strain W106-1 / CGMCC3.15140) TaxID=1229662 RepID=W3XDE5_PESFW|nr:uncharacterized protein PFICI_05077 [Pestalotiopsis fici W106-1]ETS83201.1 hypothetical protein PFICI_05077 [Pestalotiopsis fici W106-1]